MTRKVTQLVLIADMGGTFVFAVEGALSAIVAGLDPVGVLVLAFLTALGGGVARDVMIGVRPVAAVSDWRYTAIVLVAGMTTWLFHPYVSAIPFWLLVALDAGGLALFAIAGTRKALDYSIHPMVSVFLGTASAVGGGFMRDIVLNQVSRVLRADIYATAAMAGCIVVAVGYTYGWSRRNAAIAGGLLCFGLRMIAVAQHWQLPNRPF